MQFWVRTPLSTLTDEQLLPVNRDSEWFVVCVCHQHRLCLAHLSQVQDEAVALVEALPAQRHLLGTDIPLPLDLVKPVDGVRTGLGSPETRLHATLLCECVCVCVMKKENMV